MSGLEGHPAIVDLWDLVPVPSIVIPAADSFMSRTPFYLSDFEIRRREISTELLKKDVLACDRDAGTLDPVPLLP